MKKLLRHVLGEVAGIAETNARFYIGSMLLPVAVPVAVAVVASLSAASFGSWLATATGRCILSELHRRARLREPRPPSPSLRGTPTPEEFAVDAAARPRTLAIRLRLGSRLADLAPTLDSGNRYAVSPAGAKRISGRGRGVKGWMEDNRIRVNYNTLMRYRRLAVRLRALLALDERIPLEWLLPGTAPDREIPRNLQRQCAAARRKLAHLLRSHWNFCRLQKHVDGALGIPHLLQARRAGRTAVRVPASDGIRTENTKRALIAFLRETDLPPRQEKLRCSALAGFL